MWDLPGQGIKLVSLARRILNHWATRKALGAHFLNFFSGSFVRESVKGDDPPGAPGRRLTLAQQWLPLVSSVYGSIFLAEQWFEMVL